MADPIGKKPRLRRDILISLDAFKDDMLKKLMANRRKSHWSTLSQKWLRNRLRQEMGELSREIDAEDHEKIIKEAADVANFAMMIADNARRAMK